MRIEELPSGDGIADIAYIPKRHSRLPGMIVELKWNQSAGGAIRQIKEKNYPAIMTQFDGEIFLVGISYDSKSNKHSCEIERFEAPEVSS